MDGSGKITVRDLFSGLQNELVAKLTHSRTAIAHPGAKGEAAELDWKAMLESYLPARYRVDKAFVLDSDGSISDQIDLVLYDRQYSPLLFTHAGARYIPAESVYATFEVKQELNKKNLKYAQDKAASVRKLTRTSAPIVHAGGKYDARPALFEIQAGILCLDSTWNPAFGESFRDGIDQCAEPQRLNLGCVLHHGGFDIAYPSAGNATIETSAQEKALLFFFLRLLRRLQQLGTAPAIDLSQYERFL